MVPKPGPPVQAEAPERAHGSRPRRLSTPRLAPSAGTVAAGPSASSPGEILFVNRGGLVLSEVHVYLVFWGSAWSEAPTPTAADVTGAIETILASPYVAGLAQYGKIGQGRLGGRMVVTSSDPPNPFRDADIVGLLHRLIESGDLVEPGDDRQALYVVMLPPDVAFVNASVIGEHSFFMYLDLTDPRLPPDFDLANAHYGWVSNDGTLDSVTTVFSHELVEACTDPEGTAIQGLPGTCAQDGWCEIGDVCSRTGVVDGVRVQSYWSHTDHDCIIPGESPEVAAPPPPSSNGPPGSGATTRTVAVVSTTAPPAAGIGRSTAITTAAPSPNGPPSDGPPPAPTPPPVTGETPAPTPPVAQPANTRLQPTGDVGSTPAMLASLAPAIPMLAAAGTISSYAANIPGAWSGMSAAVTAILAGSLATVVIWLAVALSARRFASAALANPEEYGQLRMRVQQMKTRLQEAPPPSLLQADSVARQGGLQEAGDLIALLEADLSTAGLRWVLAVGYINAWAILHRAEEAMFVAERVDALVSQSVYDEARLDGSDIAHAGELLTKLRHAVSVLDATARNLYLGGKDDLAASDLNGTDPMAARQVLRKIRRIVNEFRDDLWGGLVRARNEFLKTIFVTGAGAFFLLVLVLLRGLDAAVLIGATAFFAFGALVGLLARIRDETKTDKAIEDFGLSTARLAAAPLYAGLAAVFGVLLVGLAHISIGSISLGPAPPPGASLPTLHQIFSLGSNPIGFLAAALFGLTPALLFDYLQTETDAFRKSIASSQPSGETPSPQK
ncbi:MAG TPA: hypothetical protein VJT14_06690 [Candidatus Dormibacteraeota bacterium]|nr:hypothetical protein [Candidatus Dormibacteraeota bacterium]